MLTDRSKLGWLDESRMHIYDTGMNFCALSANTVTGENNCIDKDGWEWRRLLQRHAPELQNINFYPK